MDPEARPARPVVVGLYGLPGAGKTSLLERLRRDEACAARFVWYEGSEVIASLVPGGLAAFQQLPAEADRAAWRARAAARIRDESRAAGRAALVTGHFLFWRAGADAGADTDADADADAVQAVHTRADLATYTHVLYLATAPEEVARRWQADPAQRRGAAPSAAHLGRWQRAEEAQLRRLCAYHGILFAVLRPRPPPAASTRRLAAQAARLALDFCGDTAARNLGRAAQQLDGALGLGRPQAEVETVVVVGDRVLDDGLDGVDGVDDGGRPGPDKGRSRAARLQGDLRALAAGPLGHSYAGLRQASLLYEEVDDEEDDGSDGSGAAWDRVCDALAARVRLAPAWRDLLRGAAACAHVGVVVLTSGPAAVWARVLAEEGLREHGVAVVGGGRVGDGDGVVLTGDSKAALVRHLQRAHGCRVVALGGSPRDVPMLCAADEAVAVVDGGAARADRTAAAGEDTTAAVLGALAAGRLDACRQMLRPSPELEPQPPLDVLRLPVVDAADAGWAAGLAERRFGRCHARVLHATGRAAARLLMTPARDRAVAGPALRAAHGRIGWYLATELVAAHLGVEAHATAHVQGHATPGFRLAHEARTLVVPLMRGGEAVALGVCEAFPRAMLVHAKEPEDVQPHHVAPSAAPCRAVLLVDAVVNTAASVLAFVRHVRRLRPDVPVVVVAGVVQGRVVAPGGALAQALDADARLAVVALRLSDNRYTGRGPTDTGNRLCNTTHLE